MDLGLPATFALGARRRPASVPACQDECGCQPSAVTTISFRTARSARASRNFEARPVVSSSAPKSTQRERAERTRSTGGAHASKARAAKAGTGRAGATNLRVRRLARGVEDGYRSSLVPGLKSSEDAERLAEEIAFSATRLRLMEQVAAADAPDEAPSIWREIAAAGDIRDPDGPCDQARP